MNEKNPRNQNFQNFQISKKSILIKFPKDQKKFLGTKKFRRTNFTQNSHTRFFTVFIEN